MITGVLVEYLEIFKQFPDGVTLHDASDGTILEANERFCELIGYSRAELLSMDFSALHPNEPPYTDERAEQYIRKAATDGPQTFEWMDKTKSGELLPVEVSLRQTAIGDDPRILAVVRDITDRKQRDRELEEKTERLTQFADMVAHDLQNPLSVAQGYLELAREGNDDADLERVAAALERMDALTSDC